LAAVGADWETLATDPDGHWAQVRFTGPFEGRTVIWNCTLATLAAAGGQRNFIEVGEDTPTGRALRIGLAIPAIDTAAIRKTLIMVRQYKRLRPGLHEFGPAPRD